MIGGEWTREEFDAQFGRGTSRTSDLFQAIKASVDLLTKWNRLTVSALARGIELTSGNTSEADRRAVARAIEEIERQEWPAGKFAGQICWSLLRMCDDDSLYEDNEYLDTASWDDRKKEVVPAEKKKVFWRERSPLNARTKLLEDVNKMSMVAFLADSFDRKIRQDKRFPAMIVELALSIHQEISRALHNTEELDDRIFTDPWKFIRDKLESDSLERLEHARELRKMNGNGRLSALIRVLEGDTPQFESLEEILGSIDPAGKI